LPRRLPRVLPSRQGLEQNSLSTAVSINSIFFLQRGKVWEGTLASLGGGEDAAPAITPYVDITLDSSYPNQSAWGTFEGNGTTSAVTSDVMAACAS
jgi:hypothetical protein